MSAKQIWLRVAYFTLKALLLALLSLESLSSSARALKQAMLVARLPVAMHMRGLARVDKPK